MRCAAPSRAILAGGLGGDSEDPSPKLAVSLSWCVGDRRSARRSGSSPLSPISRVGNDDGQAWRRGHRRDARRPYQQAAAGAWRAGRSLQPDTREVTICPITSDCVDAPLFRISFPAGRGVAVHLIAAGGFWGRSRLSSGSRVSGESTSFRNRRNRPVFRRYLMSTASDLTIPTFDLAGPYVISIGSAAFLPEDLLGTNEGKCSDDD